jgi:hypothetical protein
MERLTGMPRVMERDKRPHGVDLSGEAAKELVRRSGGAAERVSPSKQLSLGDLSHVEKDERLAAAVTSYGVGTRSRSYHRSAEKREMDAQRADATAKYLSQPQPETDTPLRGNCRSFNLPHEVARHDELKIEWTGAWNLSAGESRDGRRSWSSCWGLLERCSCPRTKRYCALSCVSMPQPL